MNSSDSRGYPLITYPIVGVPRCAARSTPTRPLAIGLLQDGRKAGRAAARIEAALHGRTRARRKAGAQRGVAHQAREPARQRTGVAGRDEQAGRSVATRRANRADICGNDGGAARHRFQYDVRQAVAITCPITHRRYDDDVGVLVLEWKRVVRQRAAERHSLCEPELSHLVFEALLLGTAADD